MSGNWLQHDRAGGDAGMLADLDIAEDRGAGADDHAVPDLRVTVAVFLPAAAQGDVMQHGDVVADLRGFPDNKAGGVIEEDAVADLRGRMNVGLEHLGGAALQVERE